MLTEIHTTSPASLRAVFRFGQSRQVRIELGIDLHGDGEASIDHLAEIARILDVNRHHQRHDPDCGECEWHQVLSLIKRCHEQARLTSTSLITSICIAEGEVITPEFQNHIRVAESAAAVAKVA